MGQGDGDVGAGLGGPPLAPDPYGRDLGPVGLGPGEAGQRRVALAARLVEQAVGDGEVAVGLGLEEPPHGRPGRPGAHRRGRPGPARFLGRRGGGGRQVEPLDRGGAVGAAPEPVRGQGDPDPHGDPGHADPDHAEQAATTGSGRYRRHGETSSARGNTNGKSER